MGPRSDNRGYPNTFIDISDMPSAVLEQVCCDDLADRFVFGSDMPQFLGYSNLLRRVFDLPVTIESKRKILYDNGTRLLWMAGRDAGSLSGNCQDTGRP
jgi:predicted TIM-barrel fold metal-dependent hydrolase